MEYEKQINIKCKSEDSAKLFKTLCASEGWTYEFALLALVWIKQNKPNSINAVPNDLTAEDIEVGFK